MSEQLNLFRSGIHCQRCGNDPGVKVGNGAQWDGFFDGDTHDYVCRSCRLLHYHDKAKTDKAGMYSEMPVVVELEMRKRKGLK